MLAAVAECPSSVFFFVSQPARAYRRVVGYAWRARFEAGMFEEKERERS